MLRLRRVIRMPYFPPKIQMDLHLYGYEACSETLNLPALLCAQIRLNSRKIPGFGDY